MVRGPDWSTHCFLGACQSCCKATGSFRGIGSASCQVETQNGPIEIDTLASQTAHPPTLVSYFGFDVAMELMLLRDECSAAKIFYFLQGMWPWNMWKSVQLNMRRSAEQDKIKFRSPAIWSETNAQHLSDTKIIYNMGLSDNEVCYFNGEYEDKALNEWNGGSQVASFQKDAQQWDFAKAKRQGGGLLLPHPSSFLRGSFRQSVPCKVLAPAVILRIVHQMFPRSTAARCEQSRKKR